MKLSRQSLPLIASTISRVQGPGHKALRCDESKRYLNCHVAASSIPTATITSTAWPPAAIPTGTGIPTTAHVVYAHGLRHRNLCRYRQWRMYRAQRSKLDRGRGPDRWQCRGNEVRREKRQHEVDVQTADGILAFGL